MRFAATLAIGLFGAAVGPALPAHSQPAPARDEGRVERRVEGRAEAGQRFAEIWCSGCHAVELRTTRSGGIAPDFPTIANRRSTTSRSLHLFLQKRHDKMPNFALEKEDAADVVAFILSLKVR